MPKAWQFISTNEHGKASNEEARTRVRKHAMRDYRRSERLTRTKRYAEEQNSRPGGAPSPAQGCPADQNPQWLYMQVQSPREPTSALDPFSTTALPENNDSGRLLRYFTSNIIPQLQPLINSRGNDTLNTTLTRSALEDIGAISSILFHASLHCDARVSESRNWSSSTLYYYGETIRILNARLRTQEDVANDTSICMVGFLAASGNITGDTTADKSHWSALQTMVDMRGGLNGLGWKGALGLVLQIGDLVHATISSAHPRLDAPDISKNPLTAIMPLGILTNTLDVNDIDSFKAEIVILIELYAHLSNIQSRILTQNPSNQDQLIPSFTQLSIALDHRLLRLGKPPSLQTGLHTAAHTVLIICAFLIFRNFSPRSQTMKALQARLIPTLTILYITTGALDRQELNMSLWILWIGALGALEQEWYAPRIQRVISALGMSKWTDLKIVLECFVWNAKLEDTACWRLCDLVGISKG